jgi:peptidyl-tRNA hydrolase
MENKDLAVYVLARTDLTSLNPGKLAAQVHHAGVQMMGKYSRRQLVQDYIKNGKAQGAVYFNTTIVLAASIHDIIQRLDAANEFDESMIVFNSITDPSYPFFVENMEIASLIPSNAKIQIVKTMDDGRVLMTREELTCAWFLGDKNNLTFKSLFEGLSLHS